MTDQIIRVLIADDHDLVRRGFATFIAAQTDMELLGEARDGQEALDMWRRLRPDVLVLDMMMPLMDGVTVIRKVRAEQPDQAIVILTSFPEQTYVRDALRAGAAGYILKNVSADELSDAIHAALTGRVTLSPEAARALLSEPAAVAQQRYNLTDREREVIALMTRGLNNPEIAEALTVTRSTIKFHVSAILAKLGVSSRAEAVAVAVENRLIDPPPSRMA